MYKFNVLKYFLLVIVISLYSCVKSESDVPVEDPVPDGMVRVRIQTNYSGFQKPTTRSDKTIGDGIWVFVLDKDWNDVLTEKSISYTVKESTDGKADIVVLLPSGDDMKSREPFHLAMIANAPTQFWNGTENKAFSAINFDEITDYTELKKKLNTIAINASGIAPNTNGALPMSGISGEFYIADVKGNKPISINLTRIAAKVNVETEVAESKFKILNVSICNAPERGWFFAPTDYPTLMRSNSGALVDYTGVTPTVADGKQSSPSQYVYESRKEERTAVIVQAKLNNDPEQIYYYRLEMTKDYDLFAGSKDYYVRNFAYKYIITDVNGKGYTSYEDAKAGGASNRMGAITATIDVTDLSSHDIVDNGEYFLGLSNSQFDFWVTGEVTLPVSTISYTSGVSTLKLDVFPVPDGGTTPTIQSTTVAPGDDLMMKFPAGFKSCKVRVMYGNLVKYITINRYFTLSPAAIMRSEYGTDDFVYGIVEPGGEWLGLSDNDNEGSSGSKEVVINDTEKGGIYIKPRSNVATSGAAYRTATAYLSRRNGVGRVKLHFAQNAVNMNGGVNGENPDFIPFGGAYWRADQTGERLIRVTPKSGQDISGYWCAATAYYDENWDPENGDGIVMDTQKTQDAGVNWTSPIAMPADMNNPANDANYSVDPNTKFVETFKSDGKSIYFRIGLQKKYTFSDNPKWRANQTVRYALAVITYTSNSGNNSESRTQVLLIRQGHDADYLMRPVDGYGNTQSWTSGPTWRPNAKQLLPYNLRDGDWSTTAKSLGVNGAQLTDYPSQAGYHFMFLGKTASPNIGNSTIDPDTDISSIKPWDTKYETCPAGYRRPNDGTATDSFTSFGAKDSEIRQSLWLSPGTGNGFNSANNDNAIMCYYADGYFDRRMIQNATATAAATKLPPSGNPLQYNLVVPNSAVLPSNVKVAYQGYLFYNPNTFASIFFPAGGRGYHETPYQIEYKGSAGSYLTSTATTGSNNSWSNILGNEVYTFSFGLSNGSAAALPFSNTKYTLPCMMSWNRLRSGMIRCVKE